MEDLIYFGWYRSVVCHVGHVRRYHFVDLDGPNSVGFFVDSAVFQTKPKLLVVLVSGLSAEVSSRLLWRDGNVETSADQYTTRTRQ